MGLVRFGQPWIQSTLWNGLTHSRQPHLRLANATIPPCRSRAYPIAQWPGGRKSNQRTDKNRKVHEANALAVEVVGWCGEVLTLGQVNRQERAARPGDNEGCEFDNGECEQLPWDPEVEEDRLERVCVGLEDLPLLLAWSAFAEMRITVGSSLVAEVGHGAVSWNMCDFAAQFLGVPVARIGGAEVLA